MSSSKIIHGIVGTCSVGLFLRPALPNLFPNEVVKRCGIPNAEIPEHVQRIFDEVTAKMQLKHPEKVKLFVHRGFGGLSVGSTLLPGGAAIGLSRTYVCKTVEDLKRCTGSIVHKGRPLNWQSKGGQKMLEAVQLGEDELRFVLAHEVSHLKSLDFTKGCFLPASWLYLTYRAVPIVVASLLLTNPLIKFTIQCSIWLASYCMYTLENVRFHHNMEFLADSNAAMVGLDYVNGGIRRMLKWMKVNTILRLLSGEEGPKYFSVEGDDFRDWAHPKLSNRLRKLEDIYAENYMQKGMKK